MLTGQLQRFFAAVGSRLKVRTEPHGKLIRLAVKRDSQGAYFELVLPRLSRRLISVMAVQSRRRRIVLQLGQGVVLVQPGTHPAIRLLGETEVKLLLSAGPPDSLPLAA